MPSLKLFQYASATVTYMIVLLQLDFGNTNMDAYKNYTKNA
jgi:hypothetical protein